MEGMLSGKLGMGKEKERRRMLQHKTEIVIRASIIHRHRIGETTKLTDLSTAILFHLYPNDWGRTVIVSSGVVGVYRYNGRPLYTSIAMTVPCSVASGKMRAAREADRRSFTSAACLGVDGAL